MRLPRVIAGGAVVAVLTGTAACGLQAVEPKLQLRDAAHEFASARTGFLRLSIPSSVDEVTAFARAADPSSTGDEGIPDADLRTILSSSLDVGYDLGKDRKSDADDANQLVLHIGDLDAGELRYIDRMAYARVDVDGLVAEFPDMQEDIDSLRADLTGADGSAESVPASVREPATALLDGRWVSLDYQTWTEQLAQISGGADDAAGLGISDYTSAKARDLLGKALGNAVSSVERRESDDRLGDHLVAKVSLRKAYTQLRAGLPGLFSGAMADQLEGSLPAVDHVPDTYVAVSFWVGDGKLTRVELDVAQFLDKPAGHLVLRADVLPGQKVTAPSGAVAFDIEALMTGAPIGGVIGPEGDPDMYPAPDAHTVASWVDEDIRVTADDNAVPPAVNLLSEVLPYYVDVAPGLLIAPVGDRIQVNLDGQSACLTLSGDTATEGTIVDTPC